VVVFAGDLVVGTTLELVLASVGYDVRLLREPLTPSLIGTLHTAHLLVLGPRLGADFREALLASIESTPEMAALPVLELATAEQNGAPRRRVIRLAWPCRMKELQQQIGSLVHKEAASHNGH
jgi:hypothetical protein